MANENVPMCVKEEVGAAVVKDVSNKAINQ